MTYGVKVKLVGGKISVHDSKLSFYLPVFSPLKNIEFTIKLMVAIGN
jgi:hypothetical protein